jgi:hypothetical protein
MGDDPLRTRKFRQAAFVYLHVGLLYECAVYVIWQEGFMPPGRGSAVMWLSVGAIITAIVVFGLWRWQNAWFARAIWALHALRLPALLRLAFFPAPDANVPATLYAIAIPVVLVNLWMLARAGWDL